MPKRTVYAVTDPNTCCGTDAIAVYETKADAQACADRINSRVEPLDMYSTGDDSLREHHQWVGNGIVTHGGIVARWTVNQKTVVADSRPEIDRKMCIFEWYPGQELHHWTISVVADTETEAMNLLHDHAAKAVEIINSGGNPKQHLAQ